ncbi:MAG: 30S ribosomal protein S17 [Candidatus Woykebacteria bacterium]
MIGIVLRKKLEKTVVVEVDRLVVHPLYKKRIKRRKRYLAHDNLGVKEGQRVVIKPTKPISKRKKFVIAEILK